MPNKLGLIAGGGALPGQLIRAARAQGRDCFVIAIRNNAEAASLADADHVWLSIG